MEENQSGFKSIDEYISQFSPELQETLQSLRRVIKEAAPDAAEKISWQMPTFTLHGNLVHFAVHQKHIGFYPGVSGIEAFKTKLAEYKVSKGAVQFPKEKPLPYGLISEIVRFRAAENIRDAKSKPQKGKK
jgi:uncharacterized protein YdhG (YjbR/CyaY superfamily)